MKKHPSILGALFLCVTLIAGIIAGRAHAAQPHILAARGHLQTARAELILAGAFKESHREKAIGLIDSAIVQVDKGIEFDRTRYH